MLNTAYSNWLNDKNDSLLFSASTAILGARVGAMVGNRLSVPLSEASGGVLTKFGNYSYMKAASYGYFSGSFFNNGASAGVSYGLQHILFGGQ